MSEAILAHIEQQLLEGLYPGASLAIYDAGVWQEHYIGTQDGEHPVSAGLAYDLASVSKVIGVSTICALWLADGMLELDKPLVHYYPDFQDEAITVRQLLTHTTGLNPFIPHRDRLTAEELKVAMNQLKVTSDKSFHYTDVNFILLGFMLETVSGQSLDELFDALIFKPWQMFQTGFGPCLGAVPTLKGVTDGVVHDPKAKVLGRHTGSAGLFSTVSDLKVFCQHYLEDAFAASLWQSYSADKPRSLGWNLDGDWIDHTGYTGPFVMINRQAQQAVIFLANRTFYEDDRPLWIEKRRELREIIKQALRVSS